MFILLLSTVLLVGESAQQVQATIVREDSVVTLSSATLDDAGLWLNAADLPKAVGFEFKPEGFCSAERCVPCPKEANWVRGSGSSASIQLEAFARHVGQSVVVDRARMLWGIGTAPADRHRLLEKGEAPDFALPDRTGKVVRLTDFKGKKILLLTWASWCGCSADLPNWQKVYDSLKSQNFEIIAAAQDSAGEAAAGKYYDRAHATFTTLVDVDHTITRLYRMVNVPAGVWIDEEGRVVRPAEVAYTPQFRLLGRKVGDDRYVPALTDWVEHGAQSRFVVGKNELKERLTDAPPERSQADVEFRLGSYLYQQHDVPGAIEHWQAAQKLDPANWNYHRQEWSFDSKKAVTLWMKKVQSLGDKPYYDPIPFPKQ